MSSLFPDGSVKFGSSPAADSARADAASFFGDGKRERVEAALGHRFRVGANFEQRSDDVGMAFGGRPHERGLPSTRLGDVHVRAMEHQLPHGLEVSGAGGNHQRRLAVPPCRARIRARLEQPLNDRVVAVGGGQRQRRFAVLVDDIHLGAGAEQRLRHRSLAEVHRPRKRGRAIRLCGIHVGFGADQRGQRLLIAALHRFEHAEVLRGRVLRHQSERPAASLSSR